MEDEAKSEATIAEVGENHHHQQQQQQQKPPLKLDMNDLLGSDQDKPVPDIVVVQTNRLQQRRKLLKERKRLNESSKNDDAADDTSSSAAATSPAFEDLSSVSDRELKEMIERNSRHYTSMASKLKDGGAKLKAKLEACKAESERRKHCGSQEVANGCKKPVQVEKSSNNGALDGSKQAVPPSQSCIMSDFASCLMKKLADDNPKSEQNTSNQRNNAFHNELSHLNRCGKREKKLPDSVPPSKRAKPSLSSQGFSPWRTDDHSPRKNGKFMCLNGKLAGKVSLTGSIPLSRKKIVGSTTDKDDSQALNSDGFMIEKTVVLVDEEEPGNCEEKEEADELLSRLNDNSEGKIYYPSREDPESLEILRSELKCLEPGECLTSTIMNFYIRYLQEQCSSADSRQHSFYFFNTYFYSKLQEAVAYQKSDKEAFFMKFRRWWKGVNIFQKAYILLPINDDNHWSLVIICIPGEENESPLMMLHLDSLGLHSSSSIFKNIKSLLKNEWEILKEDGAVDLPIPDRIWKSLPRRIEETPMVVPRQTNDYDCGLFVLYYMERFISEAPERLSREYVRKSSMFGKDWFKPREASGLRGKIKRILQEEFIKAIKTDKGSWEPVSLSSKAETTKAKAIDQDENS